jgi:hypothetical protein
MHTTKEMSLKKKRPVSFARKAGTAAGRNKKPVKAPVKTPDGTVEDSGEEAAP